MNKLHIFLIILLFQLYSRIIAYPSNFYSVDNFHVLFTNENDFYYIYGGSEKMGFFCKQNKSNCKAKGLIYSPMLNGSFSFE